ncbi:MAG: spermidine/putrescine ABC transporter substrate-binding protein [Oscillochloris sp.]|nr:spermidine/putrescine ABC transporter substrate-binding protein [Oscillochloris sp.]
MRRWILLLALLLPVLSACGAASTSTSAPVSESTTSSTAAGAVDMSKLSKELYFYNWSDYADPSILEDFEQEYGVKVIIDTYDANEDLLAKVRAGNSGYDIIAPSDYAVQTIAIEGLAQPLDKSMLTNLSHIDPELLGQYFDIQNTISVPYLLGITGIAYNTDAFPDGIDSWSALFDVAKLEQYKGKVTMLEDERETPGAALKYLGKSYNDTDPADLKLVQDMLIAQKPYLAAYNSADVNRKLASGEYVIAHAWSGHAMQARNGLGDEFSGNPKINFVIPKEGGSIWMDNLVILKDSPNAYTAHVFINYMLRPEIAARNADYIGYITPNKDAIPLLSQKVRDLYEAGYAPNEELMKRLEWIERNDTTTVFTDLWTVVKGD